MQEFHRLLEIADRLLGPQGCAWDKEQTFFSLQPYLLEETYELIEAIDSLDSQKISEELGDCIYGLIFIAKLAESEKRFELCQTLDGICEKLIRRHPHVFGDTKVSSTEEIVQNWEQIKKQEQGMQERTHLFDGIPKNLPTLHKAQKMAKKLNREEGTQKDGRNWTEEELGEEIWKLVQEAQRLHLDIEGALRRKLQELYELHGEKPIKK